MSKIFGPWDDYIPLPSKMDVPWIQDAIAIIQRLEDAGHVKNADNYRDQLRIAVLLYLADDNYRGKVKDLCFEALKTTSYEHLRAN